MKHCKSVEFISNFQCQAPLHKRKSPYRTLSATVLVLRSLEGTPQCGALRLRKFGIIRLILSFSLAQIKHFCEDKQLDW